MAKSYSKKIKICLVCSVGGHLNQIMAISEFYKKHNYYFITFYRDPVKKLTEKERVYFIKDPSRNLYYFFVNFVQSVKLFMKENPDVIILDIIMPDKNGFEVLGELREQQGTKWRPVIMLTARGDPKDVLKGYKFEADYYITKPFDVEHLLHSWFGERIADGSGGWHADVWGFAVGGD